jgi:hypothetical protein
MSTKLHEGKSSNITNQSPVEGVSQADNPKTRHQRQSELRTVLRNQGQAGLEQILRDTGAAVPRPLPVNPAAMIQTILDLEFPKPPPTASEMRISKRAEECLRRCRTSSAPLATLEKFVATLRAGSDEWTDKEIATLEDGVRKGLNHRLDRS